MLKFFSQLDRRWIFLMMGLSIAIPILFQLQFPEKATDQAKAVFDAIDNLEEGSKILLAFDYDPASEGELGPMATSFVKHCCEKKHKMYFISLWPVGPQMIDDKIRNVILEDYPNLVYGEDYVNLGFKSGNEGVIKVIVSDLRGLYNVDDRGTSLDAIPMCVDLKNIRDTDLICNVSAGYGGTKEWVQYAATPYADDITIVAGCTGVQAPLLYPYIPDQLPGLLGAIKGASEYEMLVNQKYDQGKQTDPKYREAQRRMGPQQVAHVLMVFLILFGNLIFFLERRSQSHSQGGRAV